MQENKHEKRCLDWHRQGVIALNAKVNMDKSCPVNELQAGCHSSPCQALEHQPSLLPTLLKRGGIPGSQDWGQLNPMGSACSSRIPWDPSTSGNHYSSFLSLSPLCLQDLRLVCKLCVFTQIWLRLLFPGFAKNEWSKKEWIHREGTREVAGRWKISETQALRELGT